MTEVNRDTLVELSRALLIREGRPRFEDMLPWQQVFTLVWVLDSEVHNGGFDQWLFNSSGDFAVETPSALREIGADATAGLVDHALSVFEQGRPPRDIEQRRDLVDLFDAESETLLHQLDNRFYARPEPLEELLLPFVARHLATP